jgi:hypothetical protein
VTTTLSVIGSRGVTVTVGPSALPEAPSGVAVELTLYDGPLVLTLTRDEAEAIAAEIVRQLAETVEAT